jgi:hypothetical protein
VPQRGNGGSKSNQSVVAAGVAAGGIWEVPQVLAAACRRASAATAAGAALASAVRRFFVCDLADADLNFLSSVCSSSLILRSVTSDSGIVIDEWARFQCASMQRYFQKNCCIGFVGHSGHNIRWFVDGAPFEHFFAHACEYETEPVTLQIWFGLNDPLFFSSHDAHPSSSEPYCAAGCTPQRPHGAASSDPPCP